MDKWLSGSSNETKVIKTSLNLVPEESVDDPEPITFASTSSKTIYDKTEPKITHEKKNKVVRRFNEKWSQMSEFKNWLIKKVDIIGKDVAFCKVCCSMLSTHVTELKRHALSAKHLQNSKQIVQQTPVSQVFQTSTLTKQTRIAELKLTALFASNNLSFSLSDTLTPLLSNIFSDSKIAKNLSLKRTKTTAIMKNVLGNTFFNELCQSLKQPGCFYSIIMDESTDISEVKQCALVIIFFDTESMLLKTQFLDMVETSSGTADHLPDILLKYHELPCSNASVERLFSDLKNIKTLHRNKLCTVSLVGILRTKHSVTDCISFKPSDNMIKSNIWD
ncbi:Uncharacterized protein FWK35_00037401 [Aphis craccivora]|uniref:Uncharacterized protein n=1 Tax=Aphis craccivora TaxID=307492 RepID=A0A6G0VT46_APHCR|nr:Uncharacterized protein FWK35_00037401 [Aphis craccivora]